MRVAEMPEPMQRHFRVCMDEAIAEVDAAIDTMSDAEYEMLMAGDHGERGTKRMIKAAMERRGWSYEGPWPGEDA